MESKKRGAKRMFLKTKMWCSAIRNRIKHYNLKRKYPDYKDDEYNCEELKFIWGIKSADDLTSNEANLYTMNDLDIVFDRERNEYLLGIETIYSFAEGNKGEIKYLECLLDKFTEFVKEKGHISAADNPSLCCIENTDPWRAGTISELYIRFKIFVNGYKSVVSEIS